MTTAINERQDAALAATRGARADGTVAISIAGVSKTYPVPLAGLRRFFRMKTPAPVEALKGVSFDVREGEIFGLIGRNGAGKTTLAKIIATLVQPTEGAVTVRGFDSVRDDARVRAQVGLASAEERSFYWRLNVEQNLVFFARLYGLGAASARRRIEELLELVELADLRRRRFGELSTGNKQRMAVARSLLNSPPVLLLDEPTRSLDPLAAARMREIIGSLARGPRPVTVLLTSHNLAEVEQLCERVAVISHGRIRAIDTPQHLRATHRQHERVRLTLRGLDAARAADILRGTVSRLETSEQPDGATVIFEREVGDDLLDRAVRALQYNGARVVECEPERGTLLDVLETFERETEEG
ncbi:MAG: daunorubicin ABC transporter ATP-binding protein [Acidobacteria bacterium]|nr:MAG: daunorubicin ABC transporter ATP-binding protein [Acidobacteriota bacterium]